MLTTRLSISITILMLVFGCASPMTQLKKGEVQYRKGKVAHAEKIIKPLEKKSKHSSYPLFLLSLGSVQLSLGDYRQAQQYLSTAVRNIEVEIGKFETGKQLLKAESSRLYRGFPHEKVLAHTYLGLTFMQQGKYNDARIEFAEARESDKGKDAGQEDDFATAYFLDGLNAIKDQRYDDARVSFRKVSELKPEFPFGWYGLARASILDNDEYEAEDAWKRYESLTQEDERLSKDGLTPCMIFLIDVGWAPIRKSDIIIGQFASWKSKKYDEHKIFISSSIDNKINAFPLDDTYYQASTTGGLAGDAARKIVSVAAKTAVKQIPCVGLFVGESEADVRSWTLSPGKIFLSVVPIPSEPTTIEINAYSNKDQELPLDTQVLYYLKGKPFDEVNLVYIRVLPNADYREIVKK